MASKKFAVDIDLQGNTLKNPAFDNGAVAIAALATNPLARANHTGSQTASTISDFDSQVRSSRLDQMAAPIGSVAMNSQRITGLGTPSAGTDAATKTYVDSAVNGTKWLAPVIVATTANITLSGEQTIDGVTTSGSRVLVKNQTTAAQNGVYLSAAGSWTRVSDLTTGADAANAAMFVEQGTTYADTQFVCTSNTGSAVVGTDSLTFTQIGSGTSYSADESTLTLSGTTFSIKSSGVGTTQLASNAVTTAKITDANVTAAKLASDSVTTAKIQDGQVTDAKLASTFCKKYAATIGDGASTSIAVTHSLGSRDVIVSVHDASTYAEIECQVVKTSTSVVTLDFTTAPSTNAYRVTVIG